MYCDRCGLNFLPKQSVCTRCKRVPTRYWFQFMSLVTIFAAVLCNSLLGVFLLGVLTKRANQRGAMVGMLFGFATELYLWRMHVPWTWWVMIGTIVAFAVGYAASLLMREKSF